MTVHTSLLARTLRLDASETASRDLSLYAWPRIGRSRVVVLARDRKQALSAVRTFGSAPHGVRGRLIQLAATAHRAMLSRIDASLDERSGPSLIAVLHDLLPGTHHVAGRTGGARANQKPVVMIFDSDDAPIGVAKIATNELTRRLLANEHATLRELASVEPTGFTFPHVLAFDAAEGLLVMEALDLSAARPLTATDSVRAINLIAATGSTQADSPLDGGVVHDAFADLDSAGQPVAAAIAAAGRSAIATYRQQRVRTGAWHGDWTQHNAGTTDAGFLIWDWERYEQGAPVGFDELHRLFQASARGAPTSEHVEALLAQCHRYLAPFGVDQAAAPGVALAYLVTIAARYLRDDQRAHSPAVGAVEDWLLGSLTRRAGERAATHDPGAAG